MEWRDAKLLLQASEKSRKIIESYFTPGKKLHFSFTHLVCRTAVDGKESFILLVPVSQRVSSHPATCSQETVLPLFSLYPFLSASFFLETKNAHAPFCNFSGEQEGRMDLSHPVHADNCLLDPEGQECWKEPPAYVYRDYR